MLSKCFVELRYHAISHFICTLNCWRWKVWKAWVIHNCQSRWFQLTGSNVLFFGSEFSHFFNLQNIILTHTKDYCEKKTNRSDLQKKTKKQKRRRFLQLVTAGGHNRKEFKIFSTFILVYSQIWLKILMYDHHLIKKEKTKEKSLIRSLRNVNGLTTI